MCVCMRPFCCSFQVVRFWDDPTLLQSITQCYAHSFWSFLDGRFSMIFDRKAAAQLPSMKKPIDLHNYSWQQVRIIVISIGIHSILYCCVCTLLTHAMPCLVFICIWSAVEAAAVVATATALSRQMNCGGPLLIA